MLESAAVRCNKPADESGLCSRHRRVEQARLDEERARRAPATPEQLSHYNHLLGIIQTYAQQVQRQARELVLAEGAAPYARSGSIDRLSERLQRAFGRLATAEAELRESIPMRQVVLDRWTRAMEAQEESAPAAAGQEG